MKTVLITGGAKRLGRALVETYAGQGWQVLFTARRSLKDGAELTASLGERVHCLPTEVSTQSQAALIAQWVARFADGLDLMVCNASSFKRISVAETTPDDLDDLLSSNLTGPFFLAQQCAALLSKVQGSIVLISDAQALSGAPEFAAYCAGKAGLISLAKSLAIEFAPEVRVNAVLPGTLPWPEDEALYPPARRTRMEENIPLRRIGAWSDVVQAVQYLESANYVTGICLPVDGGRSAVY